MRTVRTLATGLVVALVLPASVPSLHAQPTKATASAPLKVKEDKPGLLAKAKISPDSAIATARAAVPNGTISSAEIENEDGALIYSFDIKVPGKKGTEELHIDALSGKLLKREHEGAADEKAERATPTLKKRPPAKPPL
jgi:hypothetical protein